MERICVLLPILIIQISCTSLPTQNVSEVVKEGRSGLNIYSILSLNCGIIRDAPTQRAAPLFSPWMVAILRKTDDGREEVVECGATLISERHAITSAECLAREKPTNLSVVLGSRKLQELSFDAEVRPVDRIVALLSDERLAILEFQKVFFTDKISPICIDQSDIDGILATIGWQYPGKMQTQLGDNNDRKVAYLKRQMPCDRNEVCTKIISSLGEPTVINPLKPIIPKYHSRPSLPMHRPALWGSYPDNLGQGNGELLIPRETWEMDESDIPEGAPLMVTQGDIWFIKGLKIVHQQQNGDESGETLRREMRGKYKNDQKHDFKKNKEKNKKDSESEYDASSQSNEQFKTDKNDKKKKREKKLKNKKKGKFEEEDDSEAEHDEIEGSDEDLKDDIRKQKKKDKSKQTKKKDKYKEKDEDDEMDETDDESKKITKKLRKKKKKKDLKNKKKKYENSWENEKFSKEYENSGELAYDNNNESYEEEKESGNKYKKKKNKEKPKQKKKKTKTLWQKDLEDTKIKNKYDGEQYGSYNDDDMDDGLEIFKTNYEKYFNNIKQKGKGKGTSLDEKTGGGGQAKSAAKVSNKKKAYGSKDKWRIRMGEYENDDKDEDFEDDRHEKGKDSGTPLEEKIDYGDQGKSAAKVSNQKKSYGSINKKRIRMGEYENDDKDEDFKDDRNEKGKDSGTPLEEKIDDGDQGKSAAKVSNQKKSYGSKDKKRLRMSNDEIISEDLLHSEDKFSESIENRKNKAYEAEVDKEKDSVIALEKKLGQGKSAAKVSNKKKSYGSKDRKKIKWGKYKYDDEDEDSEDESSESVENKKDRYKKKKFGANKKEVEKENVKREDIMKNENHKIQKELCGKVLKGYNEKSPSKVKITIRRQENFKFTYEQYGRSAPIYGNFEPADAVFVKLNKSNLDEIKCILTEFTNIL